MSIRDNNRVIIIEDGTTGEILDTINIGTYNFGTINSMIMDLFYKTLIENHHSITIKEGYKNYA